MEATQRVIDGLRAAAANRPMNLAQIQPGGRRRHLVTRERRVYTATLYGAQHQTRVQSFFVLLSFSAFRAGPRSTTPPNPRDSKHAQYAHTRRRTIPPPPTPPRRVNNIISLLYIYAAYSKYKRFTFTRSECNAPATEAFNSWKYQI